MLKKLSASLGIGSAKVDTIISDSALYQDDTITGIIHIFGGNVEQQIDAISLKLCTEMKVETDSGVHYQTFTLISKKINTPFLIQADEKKEIPFLIPLHKDCLLYTSPSPRDRG